MVRGGGRTRLIAAKILCCGVLLLFVTGVVSVSGLAAWFRGGSLAWLTVAAVVALSGLFLWRRRRARASSDGVGRSKTTGNS